MAFRKSLSLATSIPISYLSDGLFIESGVQKFASSLKKLSTYCESGLSLEEVDVFSVFLLAPQTPPKKYGTI
jgi:hypothetical protein